MTTIETIGKKWIHPKTGEVRYYVNDCWEYGGLEIERYNTGNICYAEYKGKKISNSEAGRMIGDIYKCWISEEGKVFFYGDLRDKYADFRQEIRDNIKAKLSE